MKNKKQKNRKKEKKSKAEITPSEFVRTRCSEIHPGVRRTNSRGSNFSFHSLLTVPFFKIPIRHNSPSCPSIRRPKPLPAIPGRSIQAYNFSIASTKMACLRPLQLYTPLIRLSPKKKHFLPSSRMITNSTQLAGPLQLLPPVDFCCAYGSSLLSNNKDKTSMVDYIIGVADPEEWHAENLERNRNHYSWWMAGLGPKIITYVADRAGVGVHFNPFVEWREKRIKYGVVRMHDLARDILTWDRFYLSGRLQKPVHVLIDNWDIRKVNIVNLKAATCAALLLLPPVFTEEDLYVKICSLSYMGDLRMLFAEDKDKVKKIVQGKFKEFQAMYKPLLVEYADEGLLDFRDHPHFTFHQDCGLSATASLFSSLPSTVHNSNFWGSRKPPVSGEVASEIIISSREQASHRVVKALRRAVLVSSVRQAVSGLIATGGVNAARYVSRKISKSWKSRSL